MPLRDDQLALLLDRYDSAIDEVRRRVETQAAAMWSALGSWGGADVDRFAVSVAPLVKAGRRQTASLTDLYLATHRRAAIGEGRPVGNLDAAIADIRNGAEVEAVYRRPGVTVWTAVSKGAEWPDAVQSGLARVKAMVATDMQLAHTHTTLHVLADDDRIVGYRRNPRGKCCHLCQVASTQRYHRGDLMPIHAHCNCRTAPIYGTADPGRVIEPEILRGTKNAEPRSARRDRPTVRMNGEIGPVLTVKGQHFTGPDDLVA